MGTEFASSCDRNCLKFASCTFGRRFYGTRVQPGTRGCQRTPHIFSNTEPTNVYCNFTGRLKTIIQRYLPGMYCTAEKVWDVGQITDVLSRKRLHSGRMVTQDTDGRSCGHAMFIGYIYINLITISQWGSFIFERTSSTLFNKTFKSGQLRTVVGTTFSDLQIKHYYSSFPRKKVKHKLRSLVIVKNNDQPLWLA